MVLVDYERTWTFGLCSFYFFCNMVAVRSFSIGKTEESHYVSDDKVFQKNYRFEDFFWTGSGDGPVTEELFNNDTENERRILQASPYETWKTTTVFHTTTILFATVYPNTEGCLELPCKPEISPVQTESIDFSLLTFPLSNVPNILPSPTQNIPETNEFNSPETFPIEKNTVKTINGVPTINTFYTTPTIFTPKYTTVFYSSTTPKGIASKTDRDGWNVTSTSPVFRENSLDQKYWITTVLRNDNYSPKLQLNTTENVLSSLYRKAFNRRQDKLLIGNDFRDRRDRKLLEPVKVQIINVTRTGRDIELIYFVTVGGDPVPALSAANDMRLMTSSEVIAELGYPILTKAEPYMKSVVPLGARVNGRTRDTWLLIGSVIAAVLLLIILAAFFALGLSKKRAKRNEPKGIGNRKQVFEEEEGNSNLAFEEETTVKSKNVSKQTHKSQSRKEDVKIIGETSGPTVKFTEEERRESLTSSSCSGSSEASLVRLRHQQRKKERKKEDKEEKPKPKPRTRIRRIESSDCSKNYRKKGLVQAGEMTLNKNSFDEITTEGCDDLDYSPRMIKSPTSYLSMPSVKAFPRGAKIPEPLNKVLEPTSIRHLDADSDSPCEYPHSTREKNVEVEIEHICEVKNKLSRGKAITRHASLEGDDPGFIGPVVWNRHCRKINEGEPDSLNIEADENVNVGRMRKRFNELLDDALSMFGSRTVSPDGSEVVGVRQNDARVHSAVVRPAGITIEEIVTSRPKTTGSKRPQSSVILGPKGAWETPSCSTLGRPLSAGVFEKSSPKIDKNLIYVNSELTPSDPAIPLITAIKNELKKFEEPS